MSKINLYIDCTSGISGDMLCKCLVSLCGDGSFVEEQQNWVSDELLQEQQEHHHEHQHGDADKHHTHAYSHRSFQSILTMLSGCGLDENVKAMVLKTYTILAIAEAEVHGETLETVHFHEVGRPQAIINMVGIAAALVAMNPDKVFCSEIIDGTGTVQCAHGEILVPVPAVLALMKGSNLRFSTEDVRMEMVTPTGLAALLAMEPLYMEAHPEARTIVEAAGATGDRKDPDNGLHRGLKITLFRG